MISDTEQRSGLGKRVDKEGLVKGYECSAIR